MNTTGLSQSRLERMHRVLSGYIERQEMPGLVVLVSHHDDVHVETLGTLAFGHPAPMKRDTIFRIASITKPVTAVAAMILVEECKLRLDPHEGMRSAKFIRGRLSQKTNDFATHQTADFATHQSASLNGQIVTTFLPGSRTPAWWEQTENGMNRHAKIGSLSMSILVVDFVIRSPILTEMRK